MKRSNDYIFGYTAQSYLNDTIDIRRVAPVCAACGGTDPDGDQVRVAGSCGSSCGTGDHYHLSTSCGSAD